MSQPFIGEIRLFGGNFAPVNWALCNGQLLPISSYSALFSLIGTTYGGNGVTNFALPDLRGRVPVGEGQGPGLSLRVIGEMAGVESVTLLSTNLPAHSHPLLATTVSADLANPNGALPADVGTAHFYVADTGSPAPTFGAMKAQSVAPAGGGQPHDNLAPFQCLTFIICLNGIFPSRN
jgi:microcystin-dependent protein